MDKSLFSIEYDTNLCAVYTPLEGRKYSPSDYYFEIEDELIKTCYIRVYVYLKGDFKSRVCKLNDYIEVDCSYQSYKYNVNLLKMKMIFHLFSAISIYPM